MYFIYTYLITYVKIFFSFVAKMCCLLVVLLLLLMLTLLKSQKDYKKSQNASRFAQVPL